MFLHRAYAFATCLSVISMGALAQQRATAPRPAVQRPASAVPAAAAVVVAGMSEIVIDNGDEYHTERIPLGLTHGDWFTTPSDAHVSLELNAPKGATRPVRLDLELDGKSPVQVIERDNNIEKTRDGDIAGHSPFTFLLTMTG